MDTNDLQDNNISLPKQLKFKFSDFIPCFLVIHSATKHQSVTPSPKIATAKNLGEIPIDTLTQRIKYHHNQQRTFTVMR